MVTVGIDFLVGFLSGTVTVFLLVIVDVSLERRATFIVCAMSRRTEGGRGANGFTASIRTPVQFATTGAGASGTADARALEQHELASCRAARTAARAIVPSRINLAQEYHCIDFSDSGSCGHDRSTHAFCLID